MVARRQAPRVFRVLHPVPTDPATRPQPWCASGDLRTGRAGVCGVGGGLDERAGGRRPKRRKHTIDLTRGDKRQRGSPAKARERRVHPPQRSGCRIELGRQEVSQLIHFLKRAPVTI